MTVQIIVKDITGQLWSEYTFKDNKGTATTYRLGKITGSSVEFTAQDSTGHLIGYYKFPSCTVRPLN